MMNWSEGKNDSWNANFYIFLRSYAKSCRLLDYFSFLLCARLGSHLNRVDLKPQNDIHRSVDINNIFCNIQTLSATWWSSIENRCRLKCTRTLDFAALSSQSTSTTFSSCSDFLSSSSSNKNYLAENFHRFFFSEFSIHQFNSLNSQFVVKTTKKKLIINLLKSS